MKAGPSAPSGPPKVVDLAQQKQKRLVLAAYDAQQQDIDRMVKEKRADVEFIARNRL